MRKKTWTKYQPPPKWWRGWVSLLMRTGWSRPNAVNVLRVLDLCKTDLAILLWSRQKS